MEEIQGFFVGNRSADFPRKMLKWCQKAIFLFLKNARITAEIWESNRASDGRDSLVFISDLIDISYKQDQRHITHISRRTPGEKDGWTPMCDYKYHSVLNSLTRKWFHFLTDEEAALTNTWLNTGGQNPTLMTSWWTQREVMDFQWRWRN